MQQWTAWCLWMSFGIFRSYNKQWQNWAENQQSGFPCQYYMPYSGTITSSQTESYQMFSLNSLLIQRGNLAYIPFYLISIERRIFKHGRIFPIIMQSFVALIGQFLQIKMQLWIPCDSMMRCVDGDHDDDNHKTKFLSLQKSIVMQANRSYLFQKIFALNLQHGFSHGLTLLCYDQFII